MPDYLNDAKIQQLRERFRRKTEIDEQQAILGNGSGVINYTQRPGYVYVRINQGNGFSAPTIARMDASMNTFDGAACIVATIGGELTVKRGELEVQQTQSATAPTPSNRIASSTYNLLDSENNKLLFQGKLENALEVNATSPYSQSVVINGETWVDNGTFNTYQGETLDLSGDYPASGKRNLTVIFLAEDGTIETQSAADAELLDPPTPTEIQTAIDAASLRSTPLMAVNLVNGDNEIKPLSTISTQSCLWDDLRTINNHPILADVASGFFDTFTVNSGNAISATIDSAQRFDIYWFQGTPGDGDSVSTDFFLAAGSYTLYATGESSNAHGIIDWSIDGVDVITGQDWYSGGVTRNVTKTGSVTVTGSGVHTLTLTINGKNASSSNYFWTLTRWVIR